MCKGRSDLQTTARRYEFHFVQGGQSINVPIRGCRVELERGIFIDARGAVVVDNSRCDVDPINRVQPELYIIAFYNSHDSEYVNR